MDAGRPLPRSVEVALRADGRASAKAILAAVERRRRANRSEGQRLRGILRFEVALWAAGARQVAGVDEAGMSPLAGPVAAAAVVFPPGTRIPGVDDCKRVDPATRERLAPEIRARALACSVAFVEPAEIDTLNIYWAGIAARPSLGGRLILAHAAPAGAVGGSRKARRTGSNERRWTGQGPSLSNAATCSLTG